MKQLRATTSEGNMVCFGEIVEIKKMGFFHSDDDINHLLN